MVKKIYGLVYCPACMQVKKQFPEAEYVVMDNNDPKHKEIIEKAIAKGQFKAPIILDENDEIIDYQKG